MTKMKIPDICPQFGLGIYTRTKNVEIVYIG